MSLESHFLSVFPAGAPAPVVKTLAEWCITKCVVTHRDGGDDEMEITVKRGLDEPLLFSYNGYAALSDPSGTTRFVGWCLKMPRIASARSETHTYHFKGPMWLLERRPYEQDIVFTYDATDYHSHIVVAKSGRVILHRKITVNESLAVTVGYRNLREQIEDAFNASGLASLIAWETERLPALRPPLDEQLDKWCSDIIRGELRWCPGFTSRWNYQTLGRLAVMQFAETFNTYTINLSDTDVEEFEGEPRYDLLAGTVRITYIVPVVASENPSDLNSAARTQFGRSVDESVIVNGSDAVISSTVKLNPPRFEIFGLANPEDAPANGLAALLHAGFKTLYFDMDFSRKGHDVDWTHEVGDAFNFIGGDVAFTDAKSICRVITRDIGARTTRYKCGSKKHLGLDDLIAIVRANRMRGIPQMDQQSYSGIGQQTLPKPPDGKTTVLAATAHDQQEWLDTGTCAAP